ncbi:hypothetical protein So717_42460 [Roseobacter cerasinus]|uniref:Uncharacterized protein n=1 Tax=Roseobacter cerasinus TaxID=2602289 RepID=A0A640VWH2_9RHOB|nr:methyltransferase domain-containing protein [Roseobacter cerasinus]GFE52493.1 hypothetical protein So717_42460 [Roseobacter cerasinus]
MSDLTVNRFRQARGRLLRAQIERMADHLGRDLRILDVGGRADYWKNVGLERIAHIDLLNYDEGEFDRTAPEGSFTNILGDACDLKDYADKSVDFVHSNSVIEHVGDWGAMTRMAKEVVRVGQAGWVQTPAWEFPIEPHFRAPFLHWFGAPLRRRMLSLSKLYRQCDIAERRIHIDRINLLSKSEVATLFPDCEIHVERLVLAKSYCVHWKP